METTKEYRVILTRTIQQVKIVKAESADKAVMVADEADWYEEEDVIESSMDAYLNNFNPTK